MPKVNFLAVGAQKAGTTALHHYLGQHPRLCLPSRKELHYFDDDRRDWSGADHRAYEEHFFDARPDQLCGEVTPAYMFQDRFIQRIAAYNSEMRVIAILRNPVERAWSNWRMERTRGKEDLDFSQAIRSGRKRVVQDWRTFSYIERGFYAPQIAKLLEAFRRDRCHLIITDDIERDVQSALAGIFGFLGVPQIKVPHIAGERIRPFESDDFGKPSAQDISYLSDLYAEDIAETGRLIGRDLDKIWGSAAA